MQMQMYITHMHAYIHLPVFIHLELHADTFHYSLVRQCLLPSHACSFLLPQSSEESWSKILLLDSSASSGCLVSLRVRSQRLHVRLQDSKHLYSGRHLCRCIMFWILRTLCLKVFVRRKQRKEVLEMVPSSVVLRATFMGVSCNIFRVQLLYPCNNCPRT